MKSPNYRPVSLTSHVIKVFERVIQKKVLHYLESNKLLSCNQHGFRKGCSCLSELLAHFNEIYENLGNKLDTDTIYLDFSKAFDKVDHALLIKKLQLYGIGGKLLVWFKAFLSNRKQKVVVNGMVSAIQLVLSGVPQGTVLGPLLFLLFVNDLEGCVKHSKLKLFADDSRLIKSLHPSLFEHDAGHLQDDLDAVLDWAKSNNMVLNASKFQLICHNINEHAPNVNMRLLHQLPFSELQYFRNYSLPDNKVLENSDGVTDLGIFVTDDFSFDDHVSQIASKANLKASWILSVFYTRDYSSMLTLFKSLVLSIVEYCCPLWAPYKIGSIAKLEGVQRRFTSKIAGLQHLDYWKRLEVLKLMSLQRRRERYILIYSWKVLHEKVPNDVGLTWCNSMRRGKVAVIPNIPSSVAKINSSYDQFFKVRAGKLWNCLPKHVNTKQTLVSFKEGLDLFLRDIPDCPPVTGYTTVNSNSLLDWQAYGNT